MFFCSISQQKIICFFVFLSFAVFLILLAKVPCFSFFFFYVSPQVSLGLEIVFCLFNKKDAAKGVIFRNSTSRKSFYLPIKFLKSCFGSTPTDVKSLSVFLVRFVFFFSGKQISEGSADALIYVDKVERMIFRRGTKFSKLTFFFLSTLLS